MQKRLSLPRPTTEITRVAMFLELPNVTGHRSPSLDLPVIFIGDSSAHMVATVPLEPPTRIIGIDPAFLLPYGKRLAGLDTEVVQAGIILCGAELGVLKPACWEFARTICHIFATENTERQHFLGGKLRVEIRAEVLTRWFSQIIDELLLHAVIDNDLFHRGVVALQ